MSNICDSRCLTLFDRLSWYIKFWTLNNSYCYEDTAKYENIFNLKNSLKNIEKVKICLPDFSTFTNFIKNLGFEFQLLTTIIYEFPSMK